MTSQSPRIYTYKITFEEVPYYYYGVHKEKKYNEEYWGTPITHKWCWDFYTPKKQILQFFEFTDEGWLEAQEVEKRIIKPVYNEDKWCLNENCGGSLSLKIYRDNGQRTYELGIGIYGRTPEQMTEAGKNGYANGIGKIPKEERIEISRKNGQKAYELGIGVHSRTAEQMTENGKKGGKIGGAKSYEMKVGIHGQSKEKMSENGKKGGKISGKISTSQVWECTITGYRNNAAVLARYQKAKGIDTSNRKRIL